MHPLYHSLLQNVVLDGFIIERYLNDFTQEFDGMIVDEGDRLVTDSQEWIK